MSDRMLKNEFKKLVYKLLQLMILGCFLNKYKHATTAKAY